MKLNQGVQKQELLTEGDRFKGNELTVVLMGGFRGVSPNREKHVERTTVSLGA